jgi:hypothetical protein
MKLGLTFSFSQILLCVSPRTQGLNPDFRVLYGLIYVGSYGEDCVQAFESQEN